MSKRKTSYSITDIVNVGKVMELRRDLRKSEEISARRLADLMKAERELKEAKLKALKLRNEIDKIKNPRYWCAGYAGLLKKLMIELHEDGDWKRFTRYMEKLCRFEGDGYAPWVTEFERYEGMPVYSRGIAKLPQIYPELKRMSDKERLRKLDDWTRTPPPSRQKPCNGLFLSPRYG